MRWCAGLSLALAVALAAPAGAQQQDGGTAAKPAAKPQMLIAKPKVNPLLPRPRPDPATAAAELPQPEPGGRLAAGPIADQDSESEACQWRLRALGVAFEPVAPIAETPDETGLCDDKALLAIDDLSPEISVNPKLLMTCEAVEALANWMSEVVLLAAAKHLTAEPTGLVHVPAGACHRRGASTGAATAIQISAITFKNREPLEIRPRDGETGPERIFQRVIRIGACRFFADVRSPAAPASQVGPDAAQHLHLDLAGSPAGKRQCR